MLVTVGSVFSLHLKVPPTDLPERFECMGSWPTVYTKEGLPSECADYSVILYSKGEHCSLSDAMDMMRPYGATSGRWITDFFQEV